jgi:hypothetical protein
MAPWLRRIRCGPSASGSPTPQAGHQCRWQYSRHSAGAVHEQAAEFRLAAGNAPATVDLVDLEPTTSDEIGAIANTTGLAPGDHTLEVVTQDDTETVSVTVTGTKTRTESRAPSKEQVVTATP